VDRQRSGRLCASDSDGDGPRYGAVLRVDDRTFEPGVEGSPVDPLVTAFEEATADQGSAGPSRFVGSDGSLFVDGDQRIGLMGRRALSMDEDGMLMLDTV
jgi:hypothetical protein